jgi:uncharacterized cupredoxin-like copper-binding protein
MHGVQQSLRWAVTRFGRRVVGAGTFGAVIVAAAAASVVPVVSQAAEPAKNAKTGKTANTGKTAKPRVIEIQMAAIAYEPNVIRVTANETVQFRFVNNTVAPHEALFGDAKAQEKHAKEMKAAAAEGTDAHAGHGKHSMKGYLLVKPKSTKTISYTFGKAGRLTIGCHQPGHWESGMKLTVLVQPKTIG